VDDYIQKIKNGDEEIKYDFIELFTGIDKE